MHALAVLVSLPVLLGSQPAQVNEDFWSFLANGTVVARCQKGSQDHKTATLAWEQLQDQIEALTESSDPSQALRSLHALLRTRCLRLAVEQGPPPWPSRALALKTWWDDGGDLWLQSYIEPIQEGLSTDLREVVILPPEARTVLFRETSQDPQLVSLLCSQSDPMCGADTQGWMERAREALLLPQPEVRHWSSERHEEPEAWLACEREAAGLRPDDSYTAWRNCLQARRDPGRALPLGRIQVPRQGWMLISGRRGHYQFCDETRAYDLASGAAYVAESCSALAIEEGGEVNFGTTDARRRTNMRAGRLLVENLREATWMILLKSHVEDRNVRATSYPIPRGMPVGYRVGTSEDESVLGGRLAWNTSWTILQWTWLDEAGQPRAQGQLTWPSSGDRAEAHAAALLDIAERSLVEGCPPATPPSPRTLPTGEVSSRDASPSPYESLLRGLWKHLSSFRPKADCTPAEHQR